MKNNKFAFYFTVFIYSFSLAQVKDKDSINFNRWSVELNVGQNKPEKPYALGYYTSDPTVYFNINGIEHVDLGLRYMFNPYFGAKLDFAYDIMQNQSGTASLPFETKQYRIGLQGVINFGRLLNFQTFTSRFGLLTHAGLQVSQLAPQIGVNEGITEVNGGIIIGLTPQFRLSNRFVVTGDFSYLSNIRQHLNWDGSSSLATNNLSGSLFNASLGLTLYLGSKDKHADWYTEKDKLDELTVIDEDARKRLDEIETLMNDTDRDGVPDYLDIQNNTPGGVAVDTRGRFIDANKNGVPDEMEPRQRKDTQFGERTVSDNIISEKDAILLLVEKGYVNIFFDVNKDVPNSASTNNVYYIVRFLRSHPEAKILLNGYADSTGSEQNNLELSERRVKKVYNLLVASGINANRIEINANGVDSESVNSPIGYNLARRVSVTIVK